MTQVITENGQTFIEVVSPTYGTVRSPIEAEDAGKVSGVRWFASKMRNRHADGCMVIMGKQDGRTVYLHRLLMDAPKGLQVDHINGDPLDNRRANLRLVTNQQNHFNETRARGYYWHRQCRKYAAQIMVNGKQRNLGLFDLPIEARRAYLEAKKTMHTIEASP